MCCISCEIRYKKGEKKGRARTESRECAAKLKRSHWSKENGITVDD